MIIVSVSWVGICVLCLIEYRSNFISDREKLVYKKIVIFIFIVVLLIIILSFFLSIFVDYFIYSVFVMFWIFVMLVLGKLKVKV